MVECVFLLVHKLEKYEKKCAKQIFFKIPISLKQGYVRFRKYEILGDDNMRVIFHSQARFSDLGTIELFARMVYVEGSSGRSALNLSTGRIEGSSRAILAGQHVTAYVSFLSFIADLPV
ncbi:hypothetical protein Ahy_A10g049811 [Arachis hypogaea]|uniref:Uncharacterized protein n=1 Tax=Arachis hypogaea TaxID=3818 RepID=A0A445B7Z1_ARAHY|nr:hypothetical protein Ahy_A10g049811 [Arachis hypogaea]